MGNPMAKIASILTAILTVCAIVFSIAIQLMSPMMLGNSIRKLFRDSRERKWFGISAVSCGAFLVAMNLSWLRTGDIHRPGYHMVMRGGWFGFWFTTVAAVTVIAAGVVLVCRKSKPPESP
jgi:hypothetical protein